MASGSSADILLSFDVEEFDLPCEYNHPIRLAEQLDVGAEGFRRVLTLLEDLNITATMFTTAVFAVEHQDLIKRAAARHEIASHGWSHTTSAPADLEKSRQVIEQISGTPCIGYRAARMAPTDPAAVVSAGYQYSSSENPIWLPGRYNNLNKPRRPYWVKAGNGQFLQIPASATPWVRWPLFWLAFKNAPLISTKFATKACLASDGVAVLYFHPWEFCDLDRYPLPSAVARVDGDRLIGKLRAYLQWLKKNGTFTTYAQFTRKLSQLNVPTPSPTPSTTMV